MMNEINNAIKMLTGTVNGFIVQFSGNNGNVNRNMNIRTVSQRQPQSPAGIKFSDMGSRNVRLSPVVHESNPVVNGIKFSSD